MTPFVSPLWTKWRRRTKESRKGHLGTGPPGKDGGGERAAGEKNMEEDPGVPMVRGPPKMEEECNFPV